MGLSYDPLERNCKSTQGAVPRLQTLTFQVYGTESSLTMVVYEDGKEERRFPMAKFEDGFRTSLRWKTTGLYFYYFVTGDGRYFSRGKLRRGFFSDFPIPWQLTVCDENFKVPNWWKGGIVYQIFPDRFCRAEGDYPVEEGRIVKQWGELPDSPYGAGENACHDFFGGNLKGITDRLDYLKSLCVSAIYLNPIFRSSSNHRYDTGNYLEIDPMLGTMNDFEILLKEAKKRGISIILDGVFNHTGSDSIYFNRYGKYPSVGAYQSKESRYYSWYRFHSYPESYDCWWGIKTLPAVDELNASYQNFLFSKDGVIPFWLKKGIGGFRLDVADELPDEFLKKFRKTVKTENPNAMILGEVWEDASDKISYDARRKYLQGEELDSVMNYPLKDSILDFIRTKNPENLRETIAMLLDHYPKEALDSMMNLLGTHDTPRIRTILSTAQDYKYSVRERMKRALILQFTLPGVPCIFYGDENAMEGGKDPDCRRCFDWNHLDNDLILFYQSLAKIRFEEREIFSEGFYREVYADSACLIYERYVTHRSAYIALNFSENSYQITLKNACVDGFSREKIEGKIIVQPNSYGIYLVSR